MTQFAFLSSDFPDLLGHARKAEQVALSDPRGSCFYARLTLETALKWLYARDRTLRSPYQDNLAALIYEPSLARLTGPAIIAKVKYIKDQGNRAVHDTRPVSARDAASTVRELFHVCYWIARTYARTARPDTGLSFDATKLEKTLAISASTVGQIKSLRASHDSAVKAQKEAEEARMASEEGRAALEAEIARLRAEVAAARKANESVPDTHDYGEAATRDVFIDLLLAEAGWPLDQPRDREYPVRGMPNESGEGFADYVLWGDDGKPLAVVEAKRTRKDARVGQQQARLYADCLEKMHGQRPVIFCTNGYEHWLWDDQMYPPRGVSGFLKKDELVLLHQRRGTRKVLDDVDVDEDIADRFYQTRAIRRINEAFERDRQRKALLVMATGSGKTRTVIAAIDQLMRANWARRVLFLADRIALVKQAHGAFKAHMPSAPGANLLERHDPAKNDHSGARVFLSTYPTMMGLIDEMKGAERRFGPGHFDLIVIDEAHRSVYRKYRAIFEYFDSLLIGLTATPRDEIDRDTYSLFQLERGVPTDSYDLEDAVSDGYLVPPKAVSVPLKFQRRGINYDRLPDEEKAEWDALEWDQDGVIPDRIEANALNRWVFNEDTVDKVLEHLMTHGIKVAGGDRLGKTIIFARNSKHAHFIAERFDANYPHFRGEFARPIDYSISYAQSLIDDFSEAEKNPQIAVSVDMLDTGIDVPEVVNLVFVKIVRSKTKFWQMIGRGTRLRPDLFGPGKDKNHFLIFDFCQNFEFFNQNPDVTAGATGVSIGECLFTRRVELLGQLTIADEDHIDLVRSVKSRLHEEVLGMNVDNFIVRPRRKIVEKFQELKSWEDVSPQDRQALVDEVAGLPSAFEDGALPAKQFDLLILNAQLKLLESDPTFSKSREKIQRLASGLEDLSNIPKVNAKLELILEVQTDDFWKDINVEILEQVRRDLRDLMQLIEPAERKILYTDFEDELGEQADVELTDVGQGVDKGRFNMKVRAFLQQYRDHIAILKLKRAEQLTRSDLEELERMFIDEGVSDEKRLDQLRAGGGLGLFLRSLTGLDRPSAKAAFSELTSSGLTSSQLEFVNLIVDHLCESGTVDPHRFYESPFTDIDARGIIGLFRPEQVKELVGIVRNIKKTAAA